MLAPSVAQGGSMAAALQIGSPERLEGAFLFCGQARPVSAYEFIRDLSGRVAGQFRFQITTDGLLYFGELLNVEASS